MQLARFRTLRFGDDVQEPGFRAAPTRGRRGSYHDPFFYYYHDPYYDYVHWVMLDSMLHQHTWNHAHVQVVDPGGEVVGSGDHLAPVQACWAEQQDVVSYADDGSVVVDACVPEASADPDAGSWGSDDNASWAAEDPSASTSSSDDSSSSSSDSGSSSSCGSSCSSSSSCGSSCSSGSSD